MSLLQENSMLVSFSVSMFRGTRKDDRGTLAARTALNTSSNKGSFTKQVLADRLRPIMAHANAAYNWHRYMTLPYSDEGQRLLPINNFEAYRSGMRDRIAEFDRMVAEFIDGYDQARDAEINDPRNGGMFLPSDYPAKQSLSRMFGVTVDWCPVPAASHFIVNLADEKIEEMRASVDDRMLAVQKEARNDLYRRLAESLTHISSKLKTFKEGESRLHKTTLENLRELCRIIPNLNITNDPHIEELRVLALEHIGGFDTDDLRDDEVIRTQVAQRADDILSAMGIILPANQP